MEDMAKVVINVIMGRPSRLALLVSLCAFTLSACMAEPVPVCFEGKPPGDRRVDMEHPQVVGEKDVAMTLLLDVDAYGPEPMGTHHLLLAGEKLVSVLDASFPVGSLARLPNLRVFNLTGHIAAPGIVDIHEHITGGGGEDGPHSRTPEAKLSELLRAGVTTVVGILGTDCVGRSLETLRSKVAGLNQEGVSAFMWVGCYRVPSPTLTGSLIRDLQLVTEVVGAGEIAISDHRGSWSDTQSLTELVTDARVGGMLSGKAGIVHFHVGSATSLLDPLWHILNATHGAVPITHMLPTHVSSRGSSLLKAAEEWVTRGGNVDFTADEEGESATLAALASWRDSGRADLSHVSISSDGFGSFPTFDAEGRLVRFQVASPSSLLRTIQRLVLQKGWPLSTALALATSNPASFLHLRGKGNLEVGSDGDVMVLEKNSLKLRYLFAKGQLMMTPDWVKRGMFEATL